VTWARLPLLWWRDVAVIESEPVELSVLDTFVVEAASRMGHLDAAMFTEFTGLPAHVFAALARRLEHLGLIHRRGDTLLAAAHEASDALRDRPASRQRPVSLDFIYLPHTDDLIVATEGLADFERALPQALAGAASLPATLHHVSRRELLARKIASRKVANLPASIVGLVDGQEDEPLAAMAGAPRSTPLPVAPYVECSATVAFAVDQPEVVIDIGRQSHERGKRAGNNDAAITLTLGAATGLVAAWRAVAKLIGAPDNRTTVLAALTPVPLGPHQLVMDGEDRWWLEVSGREAEALADYGSLTTPMGVEVRDGHAHVVVALPLRPLDEHAKRLFALDAFLDRLLAQPASLAAAVAAQRAALEPLGGEMALRRRAWHLKHYWIVHALREEEDFGYA
jgi:hypothetical protein